MCTAKRGKNKMKMKIILLGILCFVFFSGFAESKPSTWYEFEFSKKIAKNLKVEFNPELRLLGDYKMDSYIIEGGLSYKLHKYLTISGLYRYEDNYDYKNKTGEYKGQFSANRLAFDAKTGFEKYRFSFQFRFRYTKEIDYNNTATELRYRAKLDYNIKGSKLLPYASIELFHDKSVTDADKALISGGLTSIDKIRYTSGLEYSLNKNNELSLFYRLQNNRIKNENTNILGLGFSHDF